MVNTPKHRRHSRGLTELTVQNYRSLRDVTIPLGPLNVLVGPNGAGKTNVLEVFRFLADVVGTDLEPALVRRGGFEEVVFQGGSRVPRSITIGFQAIWTSRSDRKHPDRYQLRLGRRIGNDLDRTEEFRFHSSTHEDRQITVQDSTVTIGRSSWDSPVTTAPPISIEPLSSGLSALSRISAAGKEIGLVANRLRSARLFSVNVEIARLPSRVADEKMVTLNPDAANLASFLRYLRDSNPDRWAALVDDAVAVLPQLQHIDFEYPSGPAREVVVGLHERGLRRPTPLADASYGTIRLLGLLALLYDPSPPALTCIEEIDHGLHPQALELLVNRLRDASERTQFLIATHSPELADRLRPDELIICERREDGSSAIPALTTHEIEGIVAESEGLPLGDLWFSGALGGDL